MLGKRGTLKKTGLKNTTGTVVAVMYSYIYLNMYGKTGDIALKVWEEYYPEIKDKTFYICFFLYDKPRKSASFKEFCNTNGIEENETSMHFYNKLPDEKLVATPLVDIEFEEII